MNNENTNHSRTTLEPSPSVPLKRKRDQISSSTSKQPTSSSASISTSTKQRTPPSTAAAKQSPHNPSSSSPNDQEGSSPPPSVTDQIRCICGFTHDDGWSISCDRCLLWSHTVCMGFTEKDKENLPDAWLCWECKPREMDVDRARRIQRGRMGLGPPVNLEELSTSKPAAERSRGGRKPASTAEGSRRRRVTSAAGLVGVSSTTATTTNPVADDEHVSIDDEDTSLNAYVNITEDIIPQTDTRDRLRRQAHNWRGVTAISSSSSIAGPSTVPYAFPPPITEHPISVHPLPGAATSPFLPPAYSLHTTRPIPSSHFITTYPAVITPTAEYLKDPLNSYALLGMPKQHVHLMPPPLDVALDARWCGGKGRWVRSGCKPNAVIKPVVCRFKKQRAKGKGKARDIKGNVDMEGNGEEEELGNEILSFALFASKDLKAQDEIVLGWEWDDGNVVHQLPDLLAGEHGSLNIPHIKAQMANILHNLESNFTSCACGESKTCVLKKMREFVDSPDPPPPPNQSPAQPMHMYHPPPFHPNQPFTPHQFYHHPYQVFPPQHLQYPFPYPYPYPFPQPPPPTSPEPERQAQPEDEPLPETPITSLPRQLRHKAPQSFGQPHPEHSRSSPQQVYAPSLPTPDSAPPNPYTTLASFSSVRKVSNVSSASSQDEPKVIWGSKARISAKLRHPTLNLDLGPLIGAKRGFKTKEREGRRGSVEVGGWEGCEMWPGQEAALPSLEELRIRKKEQQRELEEEEEEEEEDHEEKEIGKDGRVIHRRGKLTDSLDGGYWGTGNAKDKVAGSRSRKARARQVQLEPELPDDMGMDVDQAPALVASSAEDHIPSPPPSPPPPPLTEDRMPHKLRKKKIHMEAEAYAKARSIETGLVTDVVASNSESSSSSSDAPPLERTASQVEMPPPPVPGPSVTILEQPNLTLATPSATPTPPPSSETPELPIVTAQNVQTLPRPSTPPDGSSKTQVPDPAISPRISTEEPMSISRTPDSRSLSPLHEWEPISRVLKQEMIEGALDRADDPDGTDDVEMEDQQRVEVAPSSPLSSPPMDIDLDVSADVAVSQSRDTLGPTIPSVLVDSSTPTQTPQVEELRPAILLERSREAIEHDGFSLTESLSKVRSPPPSTEGVVSSETDPSQSILTPTIAMHVPAPLNPSQSPSVTGSPQMPLHSPLMPMSPNSLMIDSPSLQKKHKISLKDFALRRKKMREAEAAAVEEKKEPAEESHVMVHDSNDEAEAVSVPVPIDERKEESVHGEGVTAEPVTIHHQVEQVGPETTHREEEEVALEQGELKEDDENKSMIPPVTVLSPPSSPSISDAASSRSRSASTGPLPDAGPPIRLSLSDPSPPSPVTPYPSLRHPPSNLIHQLPTRPMAGPTLLPVKSSSMTVASIAHPSLLVPVKPQREDDTMRRRRAEEADMERIDRARIENDNRWMRRNNDRRREWSPRDVRNVRERDWDRDRDVGEDWGMTRDRTLSLDYGRQSRSPSPPRNDIRGRSTPPPLHMRRLSVETGSGQKFPPRSRPPPSSPGTYSPAPPPALSKKSSTSVFFSHSRTASPAPSHIHSELGNRSPPPPPALSTNPKWTSTNMVATETKGPSSLSLFNRPSRFSPVVPSNAPSYVSSAPSHNPIVAAPSVHTLSPLPPTARARSPPTQPRSFGVNKAKEPPKGPRALMAQRKEWDRDKVTGSAYNHHPSVFGNGNVERK